VLLEQADVTEDFDYAIISTPSTYSLQSTTSNSSCPFTSCDGQGITTNTLSATTASATGTVSGSAPSSTQSRSAGVLRFPTRDHVKRDWLGAVLGLALWAWF
jgi:hypothetical protein